MQSETLSNAPLAILQWKDVNTADVIPLDWFEDDLAKVGVSHLMRTPGGKFAGQARCDVIKRGSVAFLDYRPAIYADFNHRSQVERAVVRLTFTDSGRTRLLKFDWQPEGKKGFIEGSGFKILYELPPAPPYVPPTQSTAKVAQMVRPRPGQKLFRTRLGIAYRERCCVTQCQVEAVLEAAHIDRYIAEASHNVSNGVLLRSDLHVLFDANLLAIEPGTHRIHISSSAKGDATYAQWHGRKIFLPNEKTHRPNLDALTRRWEKFKAAHL